MLSKLTKTFRTIEK